MLLHAFRNSTPFKTMVGVVVATATTTVVVVYIQFGVHLNLDSFFKFCICSCTATALRLCVPFHRHSEFDEFRSIGIRTAQFLLRIRWMKGTQISYIEFYFNSLIFNTFFESINTWQKMKRRSLSPTSALAQRQRTWKSSWALHTVIMMIIMFEWNCNWCTKLNSKNEI